MSLIKCPECGKEVSDKAEVCVNCGYPISKYIVEIKKSEQKEEIKEQKKKRCPFCGSETKSNEDYCSECGFRLTPYNNINTKMESENVAEHKKIVNHVPTSDNSYNQIITKKEKSSMGILSVILGIVGILLSCISIGIMPSIASFLLGIFSISKKNKENNFHKNISIVGIVCGSVGTVLSIIFIIIYSTTASTDTGDSNVKIETNTTESEVVVTPSEEPTIEPAKILTFATTSTPEPTEEKKDEFLQSLEDNMDLSLANEVYDILKNQIGFTTLRFDSKVDGSENYVVYIDGSQGCVTAMEGYIRVFIPNSDYVFYEDGKVIMTASEFSETQISQDEMIAYYIMAQDAVEASLKNPSSAKFPSIVTNASEIGIKKNGDIVAVQSYVDAKNSFNAKIRSKWTVQFQVIDMDSYSYNLLYINIDGESSGSFVDMD